MSGQLGNAWDTGSHRKFDNAATHSALGCVSSWGVTAWCVHRRTRRPERARGILFCLGAFGTPPISNV